MAPEGVRSAWLFLLLLACFSGASVHGQDVVASQVHTNYLEITWERRNVWQAEENFYVDIVANQVTLCSKAVDCSATICRFNSLECESVDACTSIHASVTGGTETRTINIVTAPDGVTNLVVESGELGENISWSNPPKDKAFCHWNTGVLVSYDNRSSITSHYPNDVQKATQALCGPTKGWVAVWTESTDGVSNITEAYFHNNHTTEMKVEQCEPVGHTGLKVKWDYQPVCPDLTGFTVLLDGVRVYHVETDINNISVTGLGSGELHTVCVQANKEYGLLTSDQACRECVTASEDEYSANDILLIVIAILLVVVVVMMVVSSGLVIKRLGRLDEHQKLRGPSSYQPISPH